MNLGLGNRTTLKRWLLPEPQRSATTWDAIIDALGLGVAAAFARHCNRQWFRTAGDVFYCDAQRTTIALPRFPVETVTSIHLRYDLTTGWVALTNVIRAQDDKAGLVWLQDVQAEYPASLKITYTGGYWFDTAESGTPDAQPSGSTALPADLQLAWLEQCAEIWRAKDHVGKALSAPEWEGRSLAAELLPSVEAKLRPYVRFAS